MNGQVGMVAFFPLVLLQPSDRCPVCLQEGNPRGETRIGGGATSRWKQSGSCSHCCHDLGNANSAYGRGNDAHAGRNAHARCYAHARCCTHARRYAHARYAYAGRNAHARYAHARQHARTTCGSAADNVVRLFVQQNHEANTQRQDRSE